MALPAAEVSIFYCDPEEVRHQLAKASFRYAANSESREDDVGFTSVPAFPTLYKFVVAMRKVPTPDVALAHLLQFAERRPNRPDDPRVLRRARKLVLDFYRDLHTFGLLTLVFGCVFYQKGLDLRYNVDYVATLKSSLLEQLTHTIDEVGIQAAMLHPRNWEGEQDFIALKEQRRRNRARRCPEQVREWEGPSYWLTNRDRPYSCDASGVWLFGPEHVQELLETIKGELGYDEHEGPPPIEDVGIRTIFEY